jgi:GDP/UDP-N,N'-diacetylbacillosamine 2-epimerase (hydrolysing)
VGLASFAKFDHQNLHFLKNDEASMKICVVTGTRADYGLLQWVMKGIQQSQTLELQIIATGMHLSPQFGMTVEVIEADGFHIDRKVEMLLSSDTPVAVSKAMGLGMIGFADAFADLQPDMLLILGDRFELLSAAATATIARIPIAHVHGGESTEGAFDEAIRHSITKMSHLHFVAAEPYRRRVIQLGEDPQRVFEVGGLGTDSIQQLQLLSRRELEEDLGITFQLRNLLVTFHPVTLENRTSEGQMAELLAALSELENTGLVFTMPNSDTDSLVLFEQIRDFCANHAHAAYFTSLGQLRYLSLMSHFDGVVGNSSSGLLEAPSLNKGTVNIGDRQSGRLKATSVIDCKPTRLAIRRALGTLFSENFQSTLQDVHNPYGSGHASRKIIDTLETVIVAGLAKKKFFDL